MTTEERFWSKVKKIDGGCWEWTGTGKGPYGSFLAYVDGIKYQTAHRYSYVLHHGQIPEGKKISFSCGNSLCVHPDHLVAISETPAKERFFNHVLKTDGCWFWTAGTNGRYGAFTVNAQRTYAHQYSYELHRGPVPDGRMVCHTCGTPQCVRPDHLYLSATEEERFWIKVNKQDGDGCWEWTAGLDEHGYGCFRHHENEEPRRVSGAHRYSWILHLGQIPRGLWVLHKCDNPRCVRPDHLFLGNAEDNARDRMRKGRNHTEKYSDETILAIKTDYARGMTYRQIADKHGIGYQYAHKIIHYGKIRSSIVVPVEQEGTK